MARTAPVPNIPAIPGMNPGIFVLGGGGDGGGSGGGDGDGKGGKQGANGKNGGKDAQGGGKDGSGCGSGTGAGKCTQCGTRIQAGDPIDPVDGRAFTIPATDVWLPGPMPLELSRSYNTSARDRDFGLGFGWVHSLGWTLRARRRSVEVRSGGGRIGTFGFMPDVGESAFGEEGWVLHRTPDGWLLDDGQNRFLVFGPGSDEGVHRLSAIRDLNGNTIAIEYDEVGALSRVTDSAGRVLRFTATPEGRIGSVASLNAASQGRWVTFATYRYDDEGRLVEAVDADGHATRYSYDPENLLTRLTHPTGLRFHYRYDAQGRCVETWGDYGDGDSGPGLSKRAPAMLADGVTAAKGFLHARVTYGADGYSEVADSIGMQRLFGNAWGKIDKGVSGPAVTTWTYDEMGNPTSRTDPEGNTTSMTYDVRGRLLSVTDPLGRTTMIERDLHGQVARCTDPAGGVFSYVHDKAGNIVQMTEPNGAVWRYEHDSRGLCVSITKPNGGRERYEYDAHGNLVALAQANGAVWRWTYDYFGRRTETRDPQGGVYRLTYTDGGVPLSTRDALGGVTRWTYDGMRQLVQRVDPDGRVYAYVWGGYRCLAEVRYPDGQTVKMWYDREARLVGVENQRGEEHVRELDERGNLLREVAFDGRSHELKYDLANRVVQYRDATGGLFEYEYNAAGELVQLSLPDGVTEKYERDDAGRLIAVTGPEASVVLARDVGGDIVRETLTTADGSTTVEHTIDVSHARTARRTSLGHTLELRRDAEGSPVELLFDGARQVHVERDPVGREIGRSLGGGGRMLREYNARGEIARQAAFSGAGALPASHPSWVGNTAPGQTMDRRYDYHASGELRAVSDLRLGLREMEYDPCYRLSRVVTRGGPAYEYAYDAAGNSLPVSPRERRTYGAGNRIESRDDTTYLWDPEGRLVEKRKRAPEAGEPDLVWAYSWDAKGYLRSVALPDGREVEMSYDGLGRRLRKRVLFREGASSRVESTVKFVWDGATLVHEITERAREGGDPVVLERTYYIEDGYAPLPVAHQERAPEEARAAVPWQHYVIDVNGLPAHLVDEQGKATPAGDFDPFGRPLGGAPPATPLRFAGQYEDPETGLFYNRHRYYDPELGRFISTDPYGVKGDLNTYAYCPNPVGWIDAEGLHTVFGTLTGPVTGGRPQPVTNPAMGGGRAFPNTPGSGSDPDRTGDSERHLLRELQRQHGTPPDPPGCRPHNQPFPNSPLTNSTLMVEAPRGLRPCDRCAEAMGNFARQNNMQIVYADRDGRISFAADFRTTTPPGQQGAARHNSNDPTAAPIPVQLPPVGT